MTCTHTNSLITCLQYAAAWERTVGPSTAWVPATASVLLCYTGSVKAASVIGDFACDLLAFLLQQVGRSVSRSVGWSVGWSVGPHYDLTTSPYDHTAI